MLGARVGASRAAEAIGGDLDRALGEIGVGACVIDREGIVRWQNQVLTDSLGDYVGKPFTSAVAPESVNAARTRFARRLMGSDVSEAPTTLVDRHGRRVVVEVSSVALKGTDHRAVGVFGILTEPQQVSQPPALPRTGLTPREAEILGHLSSGRSTDQIVDELGISRETVRNHVRSVLRKLGVNSRLAAVAEARRRGVAA